MYWIFRLLSDSHISLVACSFVGRIYSGDKDNNSNGGAASSARGGCALSSYSCFGIPPGKETLIIRHFSAPWCVLKCTFWHRILRRQTEMPMCIKCFLRRYQMQEDWISLVEIIIGFYVSWQWLNNIGCGNLPHIIKFIMKQRIMTWLPLIFHRLIKP